MPVDAAKGVQWIRKSAARRNPFGEFLLAMLYETGWGAKRELLRAARWYRKATAPGNACATAGVSYLCSQEQRVSMDCGLTFYWYLKATKEGSPRATEEIQTYGKEGNACSVAPR